MAKLTAEGDTIVISLTSLEKLATFRAGIRIPRSAVSSATLIHTPFRGIRGIRSPGILIPSRVAAGTLRHQEGKDLLLIHSKDNEALVLGLTGQAFQRIVVSDKNPERVLENLQLTPRHRG
jgi:hypothetical protein